MQRTIGGLLLAMCLVGCGSLFAQSVFLRTGDANSPEWNPDVGCSLIWTEGLLGWNATDGTTISITTTAFGPVDGPDPIPLIWPPGYSARRAGGEVVVLAPAGNAVAATGRILRFAGRFTEPRSTVCDVLEQREQD